MMAVRMALAGFFLISGAAYATGTAVVSPALTATPNLLATITGLLAVLALMTGCVWLMKRLGMVRTGAGSVGKIVGGVSVGSRERVVVVEIGDQWIVVGVAPGRVNALAQLPRLETPQTDTASAPHFADWLKKAYDKRAGNTGR